MVICSAFFSFYARKKYLLSNILLDIGFFYYPDVAQFFRNILRKMKYFLNFVVFLFLLLFLYLKEDKICRKLIEIKHQYLHDVFLFASN